MILKKAYYEINGNRDSEYFKTQEELDAWWDDGLENKPGFKVIDVFTVEKPDPVEVKKEPFYKPEFDFSAEAHTAPHYVINIGVTDSRLPIMSARIFMRDEIPGYGTTWPSYTVRTYRYNSRKYNEADQLKGDEARKLFTEYLDYTIGRDNYKELDIQTYV